MSLSKWMGDSGAKTLNQIIMPGAHDAGIAKGHVDLTWAGTNRNTATQDNTIWQQLQCGTRFFDVRLRNKGSGSSKKVVAYHMAAGQGGQVAMGSYVTVFMRTC